MLLILGEKKNTVPYRSSSERDAAAILLSKIRALNHCHCNTVVRVPVRWPRATHKSHRGRCPDVLPAGHADGSPQEFLRLPRPTGFRELGAWRPSRGRGTLHRSSRTRRTRRYSWCASPHDFVSLPTPSYALRVRPCDHRTDISPYSGGIR